ncbi:response regulator transcription factor [Herbivorax sp. ANBcel31]|uniref:response regulator transcription factor n=1 Tax=Herbivorax sp. ANBcel31 TaxID=3069754 RepID=UPI0027B191DC|nr:response regulator transcription factor [Herbivorax sp. ANBcel31]MDQ2084942.1 response regulator transcription factor [Herbivorax sp. ANBcel31]
MYKLLIADDEPSIREGLKNIIPWDEYGIKIIGTVSNGLKALEAVQLEKPDILITDIKMPQIDGLKLIKLVKEKKIEIKFIVLSGYDDFEYLKESIKLGIENYLLKPVNRDELKATIMSTIDKIKNSFYKKIYLEEDIRIIRDNILFRWITNSIDKNELLKRSKMIGIDLESKCYCTCFIRLMHERNNNVNLKKRTNSLISKAYEICSKTVEKDNSGVTFCAPDGDIIVLFIEREQVLEKINIRKVLESCLFSINEELNCNVFICIGNVEGEFSSVHKSYLGAVKLMEYSYILSPNRIIDFEDIKSFRPSKKIVSDKIKDCLKEMFLKNDQAGIENLIDDIFLSIPEGNWEKLTILHSAALQFLIEVIGIAKELLPAGRVFEIMGSPSADISRLKTTEQTTENLKEISRRLLVFVNMKTSSINPLIKRLLDYVNSSYMEDISIKTLAYKLNTNANYLGQLFKEEMGKYFSDYLNIYRINKAKELLLNKNSKISDISNSVGYKDPAYFYRIFKKYAGLSPKEFKNFHLRGDITTKK